MNKRKTCKWAVLFATLLIALSVTGFAAEPSIGILFDLKPLKMDVQPIIQQKNILVPFRAIGEAMGATINWDAETKTVFFIKQDKIIALQIGNVKAIVNQQEVVLDVAPIIVKDR
ncbi:MAG: copper amine oxidase N-terminal domain-containing protein, partial [Hyphomonadaceae bacterium]|nr:copper amine oxidase N-terminal domain-containing protein [Clostridia bacterium]